MRLCQARVCQPLSLESAGALLLMLAKEQTRAQAHGSQWPHPGFPPPQMTSQKLVLRTPRAAPTLPPRWREPPRRRHSFQGPGRLLQASRNRGGGSSLAMSTDVQGVARAARTEFVFFNFSAVRLSTTFSQNTVCRRITV